MKYRQLGKSSLLVSEISFGCMSLDKDQQYNTALLLHAVEMGINFFDTADLYSQGLNETMIGKSLKQRRRNLIIATKVGNRWREDGSGWDWNPTKKYILSAVEQSLRRLQTDYIDLYQLHGGTLEDPIDEIVEAFEILKKQGKIRYYGISSIRPNVIREYINRSNITSVMMQYNLLDRRPEETCFGAIRQNGIHIIARGALAKGLLVNKPAAPFLEYSQEEVKKAALAIHKLSGKTRHSAQTAIQFVLKEPVIAAALIGIRTPTHLIEAAKASDTPSLSRPEILLLNQVLPMHPYHQHR
jgi:aryl-alcohol dehydrogenase-like predicted oxidoreductase